VYTMPVGAAGLLAIDTRDLAEIAALELLRRHRSRQALPSETLTVVHPEALTGQGIAALWERELGRAVRYVGDDLEALERTLQGFMPAWMAFDMRLMMRRFQEDGMTVDSQDSAKLRERLGRPLRSYRDFASEQSAHWR
jgi:uncharacterized protein YbjT (DUF2867 family)